MQIKLQNNEILELNLALKCGDRISTPTTRLKTLESSHHYMDILYQAICKTA